MLRLRSLRKRRSTLRTTSNALLLLPPSSGSHVPGPLRSIVAADTRAALAEVGYPAVIKPTHSWVSKSDGATRVISKVVLDESEALARVEQLHEAGRPSSCAAWPVAIAKP